MLEHELRKMELHMRLAVGTAAVHTVRPEPRETPSLEVSGLRLRFLEESCYETIDVAFAETQRGDIISTEAINNPGIIAA